MRNFKISDEERQSILRLHESSTKKQYVNLITEAFDFGTSMKEIQTKLKEKGYTISKSGEPDGKFGPLTFSALTAALAGAPSGGGSGEGGGTGNVSEILNTIKTNIPDVGGIVDIITKSPDLTKITPQDILTKMQEVGADILSKNPTLINTVKTELEKLGIKVPGIGDVGQIIQIVNTIKNIPGAGPIIDIITKQGVDLTKMTPPDILTKMQEMGGEILKTNPDVLKTVKDTIEKTFKIQLPDLTTTPILSANNMGEVGQDDGAMDSQGLKF